MLQTIRFPAESVSRLPWAPPAPKDNRIPADGYICDLASFNYGDTSSFRRDIVGYVFKDETAWRWIVEEKACYGSTELGSNLVIFRKGGYSANAQDARFAAETIIGDLMGWHSDGKFASDHLANLMFQVASSIHTALTFNVSPGEIREMLDPFLVLLSGNGAERAYIDPGVERVMRPQDAPGGAQDAVLRIWEAEFGRPAPEDPPHNLTQDRV